MNSKPQINLACVTVAAESISKVIAETWTREAANRIGASGVLTAESVIC